MQPSPQSFIHFYQQYFNLHSTTSKKNIKKNVLILAPHPDDECLMSSFALRLLLENKANIIAVAVTLGSDIKRQKERAEEFKEACHTLGATSQILNDDWQEKLKELNLLIKEHKIDVIIAPHLLDHHPTHIKTSQLARKLMELTNFHGLYLESEFWGELQTPNLLLEVTTEAFELQFNALTKHVGEISRNPYHLRLASYLVNNVRRGAEKVLPLGSSAPCFAFASLYQAYKAEGLKLEKIPSTILDHSCDLTDIF